MFLVFSLRTELADPWQLKLAPNADRNAYEVSQSRLTFEDGFPRPIEMLTPPYACMHCLQPAVAETGELVLQTLAHKTPAYRVDLLALVSGQDNRRSDWSGRCHETCQCRPHHLGRELRHTHC
jgi:hypothetical protein